jgi:hypothetical protein
MGAVFIQRIRRKKIKPSHVNITHPFSAREAPLHLTSSPKKKEKQVSCCCEWGYFGKCKVH